MKLVINEEEKRTNYLSVANLLRWYNIDLILNNNLINNLNFELYRSVELDEDEDDDTQYYIDVFQYYIIDERNLFIANLLNEPVYYNYDNDLYLLGITHYGTGWDYVLTDINLNEEQTAPDINQLRELRKNL